MANMSYCRFENTYRDLRDCLDALEEGGKLSNEEVEYKKELIRLCQEIARDYGEEQE